MTKIMSKKDGDGIAKNLRFGWIFLFGLMACGGNEPKLIVLYGASTAEGLKPSNDYDLDMKIFEDDALVDYVNPQYVGVEAGLSGLGNVYVVKYGISGAAISCDGVEHCLSGDYLTEMDSKISKAKEILGVPVYAYIWMKGSDNGDTYESNFLKIQNDFFDKFGVAPWISGLPKHGPDKEGVDTVREILLKYSNYTVDLDDYETSDYTHPIESEYVRIGEKMAQFLEKESQ